MVMPSSPYCAAACITSVGNSPDLSIPAARSATTSPANASICCWNAACSAFSSSIIVDSIPAEVGDLGIGGIGDSSIPNPKSLTPLQRQPFEDRREPGLRGVECFGHDADVADHRHEVGVAVPARHEVDV